VSVSTVHPVAARRKRRWTVIVACMLGIAIFAVATVRLFIWPDLPQAPPRVDAIIELAGPGHRDGLALALATAHRAPVLIQSTMAADAMSDTCLPPVPEVTVLCFHPDPSTTRGEAEYIGKMAAERDWRSIILVTSPDHAWRARMEVSRCFDGDVYVATIELPSLLWFRQIPYQWGATVKAQVLRSC
jgi:uncharacterized SAM-binding protein YcdF (DUF218 family)